MSQLLVVIKCIFYLVCCAARPSIYYRWKALGFRILGALNLYERKHLKFLALRLPKGSTCMDIGAHFGIYSRLFAAKAGTEGRVVLVEPFPDGYEYLSRTFFGRSNISVLPTAISDRSGEKLFLNIPKLHGLVPEPALASVSSENSGGGIPIETINVDDLSKNLSRLDIIKADIEGYETKFFNGAVNTLRRLKPLILFEDNNIAANIEFYRKLERKYGYTLNSLNDLGDLAAVGESLPNDYNFYFVPH